MVQTRHILIVDDDSELRGALAEQLALHEEFAVSVAENATAARTLADPQPGSSLSSASGTSFTL